MPLSWLSLLLTCALQGPISNSRGKQLSAYLKGCSCDDHPCLGGCQLAITTPLQRFANASASAMAVLKAGAPASCLSASKCLLASMAVSCTVWSAHQWALPP